MEPKSLKYHILTPNKFKALNFPLFSDDRATKKYGSCREIKWTFSHSTFGNQYLS